MIVLRIYEKIGTSKWCIIAFLPRQSKQFDESLHIAQSICSRLAILHEMGMPRIQRLPSEEVLRYYPAIFEPASQIWFKGCCTIQNKGVSNLLRHSTRFTCNTYVTIHYEIQSYELLCFCYIRSFS